MATIQPSKNPFLQDQTDSPSVSPDAAASPFKHPLQTPNNMGDAPISLSGNLRQKNIVASNIAPQVSQVSKNRRRWFFIILFLLLLVGGGIFFWFYRDPAPTPIVDQETIKTPPEPVLSEEKLETNKTGEESFASYTSENFKAGEIIVGGEAEFLLGENDITPLTISGVRGEAFTEKKKQEVKLVITWQTNRLSLATIEFSKGVGQATRTVFETDYGYNHSVIITGLDPATTYLYTIKAEDRFGNSTTSEPYAVFTGTRTVSLFDLIAGAIGDVFGWAVDK